jgi:hypothetical protein
VPAGPPTTHTTWPEAWMQSQQLSFRSYATGMPEQLPPVVQQQQQQQQQQQGSGPQAYRLVPPGLDAGQQQHTLPAAVDSGGWGGATTSSGQPSPRLGVALPGLPGLGGGGGLGASSSSQAGGGPVAPPSLFGLASHTPSSQPLPSPAPLVLTTPPHASDQGSSLPPLAGSSKATSSGSKAAGEGGKRRSAGGGRPRGGVDTKQPVIDTSVAWLHVACGALQGRLTLVDMMVEVMEGQVGGGPHGCGWTEGEGGVLDHSRALCAVCVGVGGWGWGCRGMAVG